MVSAPAVELKYSRIYKQKILGLLDKKIIAELDQEIFLEKVTELNNNKKRIDNNLSEITKILDIKWKRKEIRVYLLPFRAHGTTFSDPITISLCSSNGTPIPVANSIYLITHELIHNALEEIDKIPSIILSIKKNYHDIDSETATHIIVFAVQHIIYAKYPHEKLCEKEIEKRKNDLSLQKAWSIVLEEGSDKIIKKFIFNLSDTSNAAKSY